jgi:hypothetical protein
VLGVAATWLMIRYGRRSIGDDPLAKLTSEGGSGPGNTSSDSTSTPDTEFGSSHEDEDDLALVY